MITIKGFVAYKKERSYVNAQGEKVNTVDLDVKAPNERFPQSVSVSPSTGAEFNVGDEITIDATLYTGVRKDGKTYAIFREFKD